MTDEQVRDVRDLTRAAGIKPTTTKIHGASHPLLVELAPGERTLVPGGLVVETPAQPTRGPRPAGQGSGRSGGGRNRSRGRRSGGGSSAAAGNAAGGSGGSGNAAGGSGRSGGGNRSRRRSGGSGTPTGGASKHSAASFSAGRK
jgi:hypothetical protein